MVISHIQPLLLLAFLFFLPALQAIDFQYCDGDEYNALNITKMEFSPDAKTITISGFANEPLSNLDVIVARTIDELNFPVRYYDFCKLVVCPVLPSSNFVFTLPEIPTKIEDDEKLCLIWSYRNEGPIEDIAMCVHFDFPTSVVSA